MVLWYVDLLAGETAEHVAHSEDQGSSFGWAGSIGSRTCRLARRPEEERPPALPDRERMYQASRTEET